MNDLIPMPSEPVAPYVDPVLTPGSVCLALRQERVGLLREYWARSRTQRRVGGDT